MKTPHRRCATPPAPRATRRACCTAIAQPFCTPTAAALPDALNISARDCVLPVVPMFHVNAWSIPYSGALTGCKLVFPGAQLDGKSVYELFEQEKVTLSAGVPTVWMGLLAHMKQNNLRFSTLKRTVIGGSACPPAMIRSLSR